jgi:hypothetical protein
LINCRAVDPYKDYSRKNPVIDGKEIRPVSKFNYLKMIKRVYSQNTSLPDSVLTYTELLSAKIIPPTTANWLIDRIEKIN